MPPTAPPLVSCFTYSGGTQWHWRQSLDAYPGQSVILVHGLMVTSMTLTPLAERIAGWARVLVPDLPGFGLSEASQRALSVPDMAASLAEWMRSVSANPAHVIGSSFGCQVVAELAASHPSRVRSVTLVGPTIDPSAGDLATRTSRFIVAATREPAQLWRNHARHLHRRSLSGLRAFLCHQIEKSLPLIQAPTLILRGIDDPIAPEAWTSTAARLVPGSTAATLSRGAHCVHITHPALVAEAIRNFTFPFRQEA